MAILTLEAIGSEGERLAMAAGEELGVPVGFDSEFQCATYDADGLGDEELQAEVFRTLTGIDPAWQEHLRVAE